MLIYHFKKALQSAFIQGHLGNTFAFLEPVVLLILVDVYHNSSPVVMVKKFTTYEVED